jgi:hypothetical protein
MSTRSNFLLASIASANDPYERDRLSCELSAYLARQGKFDEATARLRDVRSRTLWLAPSVSVALFFAEAMIGLQDDYSLAVLDRLRRALAISIAGRDPESCSRVAAWIAHFHYNQGDIKAFARTLIDSSQQFGPGHEEANARIALTLAGARSFVGDAKGADGLFARARAYAVKYGDEAFLSSCLYNRPAYGVARQRILRLRDSVQVEVLRQLDLELDSALNYSRATENTAAETFLSLFRARLRMLQDQLSEARALLQTVRDTLPASGRSPLLVQVQGDLAEVELRISGPSVAEGLASHLEHLDLHRLEADDRLILLSQISELQIAAGLQDKAMLTKHAVVIAWDEYENYLASVKTAVSDVEAHLP